MKKVFIVTVGKLVDKNLEALENDYLKRIRRPTLQILECKSHAEDTGKEAKEVIDVIEKHGADNSTVVLLCEQGKKFDSIEFSKWYQTILARNNEALFFVIGGSDGHGKAIIERTSEQLSLSALTFPHKFARVLLVEQLYRAQTILEKHPYHK